MRAVTGWRKKINLHKRKEEQVNAFSLLNLPHMQSLACRLVTQPGKGPCFVGEWIYLWEREKHCARCREDQEMNDMQDLLLVSFQSW